MWYLLLNVKVKWCIAVSKVSLSEISSNYQLLYEHDYITTDAALVRLQGLYE